ncbi:MAG: hypothetical protein IKD09_04055 [Lentisphaeria bacterium]|nr:hypothetical protein [Lentisphaeria bacterium]
MKKITCVVLLSIFVCGISYANPYTRALQKARDVRSQVEEASNPDNYFEEETKKVKNEVKKTEQQVKTEVKKVEEQVKEEVKKAVKECVCPNCKLVYQAKLRVKHTKGKIKYIPPKCPCLVGGKCPIKK